MAENACVNSVGQSLKPSTGSRSRQMAALNTHCNTPGVLGTWQTEVRLLFFSVLVLPTMLLYGFPASTPIIYIASVPQTRKQYANPARGTPEACELDRSVNKLFRPFPGPFIFYSYVNNGHFCLLSSLYKPSLSHNYFRR